MYCIFKWTATATSSSTSTPPPTSCNSVISNIVNSISDRLQLISCLMKTENFLFLLFFFYWKNKKGELWWKWGRKRWKGNKREGWWWWCKTKIKYEHYSCLTIDFLVFLFDLLCFFPRLLLNIFILQYYMIWQLKEKQQKQQQNSKMFNVALYYCVVSILLKEMHMNNNLIFYCFCFCCCFYFEIISAKPQLTFFFNSNACLVFVFLIVW